MSYKNSISNHLANFAYYALLFGCLLQFTCQVLKQFLEQRQVMFLRQFMPIFPAKRMDGAWESANASDHMKMWPRNVVTESDRFCGHFAAASFGRQGRGHGVHSPPVSPICCLPQLTLLLMSVWRWLLFRLWGFDERSLRCQFFLFETCTVLSRTLLSMRATPFNSLSFLNV